MAFALLPVCIYLFIAFYGVSFPSDPYCLCCPDHPRSRPAVCAASLSVCHKENKNSKRQDLMYDFWVGWEGEGWWLGVSPECSLAFSRH